VTRIVAGAAGGRRLAVPPSGTRPTSDRVREALFSSLESAVGGLAGKSVLDLYAGSGAVGLEAWSRGASAVVLVESAAVAVKVLRANVTTLRDGEPGRPTGKIEVVAKKAERAAVDFTESAFDVVFADPPYDLPTVQVAGVLATLGQRSVPKPGATIVVERATRDTWRWPVGYATLHDRKYGDATLHYATYDPTLLRPIC
jgi:16S rRNA (guanine966-N2)-methyltransferase